MTTITTTAGAMPPVAANQNVTQLIATAMMRMWNAHIERREQNRAIAHLHGLSDHHLKDIGVSRSEITAAVRGEI
ncbi:MAG: DUF1127 domain-containing protein [Hyphomicrobiaceae bacterium]